MSMYGILWSSILVDVIKKVMEGVKLIQKRGGGGLDQQRGGGGAIWT